MAVAILSLGGWLFFPHTDPWLVGEWEFLEGDLFDDVRIVRKGVRPTVERE